MPTQGKCRPWLRAWACFRPRARKQDNASRLKVVDERASCAAEGSCHCSEFAPADTHSTVGREQSTDNSRSPVQATALQLESLRHCLYGASGESLREELDNEQHDDETDLFMASLLSDMKARAMVVTTLDTVASMHALWGLVKSEEARLPSIASAEDQLSGTSTGPCIGSSPADESVQQCPLEAATAAPLGGSSRSPVTHIVAPSDPCKSRRLDGNSGLASGAGLYGISALSADGHLSQHSKVTPTPPQRNAANVPGDSASGVEPPAPQEGSGGLISGFCGGAARSRANRIDDKYGILETCEPVDNRCAARGGDAGSAPRSMDLGSVARRAVSTVVGEHLLGPAGAGVAASDADGLAHVHDSDTFRIEAATTVAAVFAAETAGPEPSSNACGCGAAASVGADSGGEAQPPVPGSARLRKGEPAVMPSLLALLSGISELSCLAAPGALGGAWLGDWRGVRVVVKLTCCGGMSGMHGSALRDVTRASQLRHPNLITVYDVRVASADEASLSELDPPPQLRPGWAASRRPMGRLHRFLAAHPELQPPEPSCRGDASLTLYPGDIITRRSNLSLAQQALLAVRPRLGGSVVATVMEYCEMGNLQSLACGEQSPFRASRFWAVHVAQRALLRTAREVAAGMAALHAAGVTHGALRPSNVLLSASSADRRGFVARLSDVGSLSLAHAASNPLASGPCMVLLAPEALSDEAAEASRPADVYAFGMLLYVMAAGEMPFQGQHLVPVLMAVASEGLRPEWPTYAHPHLEPLFRRSVAQCPEERPNFKEILFALCSLEQRLKREKRGGAAAAARPAGGCAANPALPEAVPCNDGSAASPTAT